MASDKEFVEFIVGQIENAGKITYKMMFGEYAIYSDGKVVALVADNQLFVKPTKAGRAFIGDVVEGEPYPGAKPRFLIQDQFEDREWISNLIRVTANELPDSKKKKGYNFALQRNFGACSNRELAALFVQDKITGGMI